MPMKPRVLGAKPKAPRQRAPDLRPNSGVRGYTKGWRQLRAQVLREEPLCRLCLKGSAGLRPRVEPAVEVDHIVPVTLAPELRLKRSNLQPLCKRCHRLKTIMEQSPLRQP
jgi:5-methylcytosine-specific restriction protein A